jgi:hypothetical protein
MAAGSLIGFLCAPALYKSCCAHVASPSPMTPSPNGACSVGRSPPSSASTAGLPRVVAHWSGRVVFIRKRPPGVKKSDLKPWLKKQWCRLEVNTEFVASMEDVLEVYAAPYEPRRPKVNFDETNKQLITETRPPHSMKRSRLLRRGGSPGSWRCITPQSMAVGYIGSRSN